MSNPTPISDDACPRINRYVTVLTVLAVLFVTHSGLIPFDFVGTPTSNGSYEFFGFAASSFTIPDIVSNIFLYLPIGAFGYWTVRRRVRNVFVAILLTLLAGTALSLLVEWIQSYMPIRISSLIDLVCNIIGTALGIVGSSVARFLIPKIVDASTHELRHRPKVFAVKAYCALLVVSAGIPFSFSLDAGLVNRSLRMVTLTPFGAFDQLELEASDAMARGDKIRYGYARWSSLKHWSRWAMETASFAVFGLLIASALVTEHGFRKLDTCAMTLWLGLLLALGLSGIQILVISRDVDVTDVIFRLFGCALGLGYLWYRGFHDSGGIGDRAQFNPHRIAPVGVAFFLAYIVYTGILPFSFNHAKGGFTNSINATAVLPFFGYFVTRFDFMMDDVMEKSAAYLALGAFLACYLLGRGSPLSRSTIAKIAAIGAIVALPLELVQMYMPVRIASTTDLLIASFGCGCGAVLYRHLDATCRSILFLAPPASEALPTHTDAAGRLTPFDEILSTLAEPHPDAPKEPGPVRPPAPRR